MPTLQEINSVHALYCQLTGMPIRLDMAREHEWFEWLKRGFTQRDLRDLVAHLRQEIRAGRRNPGCLKFRNLVVNLDYFEEDLAEARARSRVQKVDPGRSDVLRATGRPAGPPPKPARSTAEIMAGEEAFKAFLKLKDNL
jgi:hypothetical protein